MFMYSIRYEDQEHASWDLFQTLARSERQALQELKIYLPGVRVISISSDDINDY